MTIEKTIEKTIEIETRGEKTKHGWRDIDGFVGPMQPGFGPRTDPKGTFPTGPDVGESLPAFSCQDVLGNPFSFAHTPQPTIMVFFRSAVW